MFLPRNFPLYQVFWKLIVTHFVAFILGGLLIQYPDKNCLTFGNNFNKYNSIKRFHGSEKVNSALLKIPSDRTFNIEELMENARKQIRNELQHYKYNLSKSGANKLEDLVIEAGGKPLRSVIVGNWRSGSTFLGEILNANPGNFYQYEPLRYYGSFQIRGPPLSDEFTPVLKSMLKCDYDNEEDLRIYFEYKKYHKDQIQRNTRMWDYCKHDENLCLDPNFTARFCKLFPFQSMKLVRFRLQGVENILKDAELNVKVVFLVRDPRGLLQSRQHHPFCHAAPDCWDPQLICLDMVNDYVAASHLLKQYPDRVIVVRYEDLTLNPKSTSYKLYDFLGLDVTPSLDDFLESHTTKNIGLKSTYRVSRDNAFKWKGLLDFDYVNSIQKSCREAMLLWGYRMAENSTHMRSREFDPIDDYTIQLGMT